RRRRQSRCAAPSRNGGVCPCPHRAGVDPLAHRSNPSPRDAARLVEVLVVILSSRGSSLGSSGVSPQRGLTPWREASRATCTSLAILALAASALGCTGEARSASPQQAGTPHGAGTPVAEFV